MGNIRRYKYPGYVYFLTHVTVERLPILLENFDLLWDSIISTKAKSPFDLMAWVVLPDHMHLLVDPLDHDISDLMRRLKLSFSARLRRRTGSEYGRVWQYRFWDHVIRDQDDLNRHIDYIHYNPVKHGLVRNPADFAYSSYRDYLAGGYYPEGWGECEVITFDGDFGE